MELKLVAEIKERADHKGKQIKESPLEPLLAVSGISHDPVSQLVTELSQSLNLEKDVDKHVTKNSQASFTTKGIENTGVSFIPQLKKLDSKKLTTKDKPEQDTNMAVIDFKSRLRKVESEKRTDDNKSDENEPESNKRESTASSDSGNLRIDDGDDKRKSTGSISSLKKLWESKDNSENINSIQLSPKLSIKNPKNDESDSNIVEAAIEESTKYDRKKFWPPSNEDKPVIPTKPPVKSLKPIVTRPAGSAIYATPIASNLNNSKPPVSAKPTNIENKTPEDDVKLALSDKTTKESILEISQALDSTLNSIRTNMAVSTSTWLQLSDKIGMLHGSCMDYADNVVPAHTKFHFRELLTRLESQARQLRSAGSKNSTDNTRCINEVNNTIKDVVNVVFR